MVLSCAQREKIMSNKTDLPCVTFEEYYENRVKFISEQIEWFDKRSDDNPMWPRVAQNLKILLKGLPEELGYQG